MITAKQIAKIQKIVRDHLSALTYRATGVGPTDEEIADLKRRGVVAAEVPEDVLKDAYLYGLVQTLDPATVDMGAAEVLAKIRDVGKLSTLEQGTLDYLREKGAIYMQGLGNKIETGTMRIVYDARKEALMRDAYKQTVTAGAELQQTRSQIVTALRDFTGDFHRDLERVVNTELHFARTEGIAQGIRKRWGPGAYAFVRPNPDCCPVCREAYIEVDGKPKIFLLSSLEISNVGRSNSEITIRPGKPPVHPHCACVLHHIDPETQEFNDRGELVFKKPSA